jgi:chromosome partitioning protein
MLQTIPVINNKGGVGKTTTCVNVAAGLAHRGRRVLVVDLDSQGSASLALGVDHDNLRPSTADALFDKRRAADILRSTSIEGLDLLTGSLDLANSDVRLKKMANGEARLREILRPIASRYDQILIDCPPSTSILSINALVAADAFIIPVTPSYLALEGVVSLGKVVRRVRRGIGEAAPVLGIVLTQVDRTESQVPAVIDQLRSHYGGKVFDTEIRYDPPLDRAPSQHQDIFTFAPGSDGADDYGALLDEIAGRIERYGAVYSEIAGDNSPQASSAASSADATHS